MGKKRAKTKGLAPPRSLPPSTPSPAGPAKQERRALWLPFAAIAGVVLLAVAAYIGVNRSPSPTPAGAPAAGASQPKAAFVGSDACASCHAAQHAKWRESQHAAALLPADGQSVRGDFTNARFNDAGVTSVFSVREGRYFVRADGPDRP